MPPLAGQGTRAGSPILAVDILTGLYARNPGLPSHSGASDQRATNRSFPCPPRPPSRAISVGTTPMIAIPVAAFMRSVAVIVGRTPQLRCNDFGSDPPMIAGRYTYRMIRRRTADAGFKVKLGCHV